MSTFHKLLVLFVAFSASLPEALADRLVLSAAAGGGVLFIDNDGNSQGTGRLSLGAGGALSSSLALLVDADLLLTPAPRNVPPEEARLSVAGALRLDLHVRLPGVPLFVEVGGGGALFSVPANDYGTIGGGSAGAGLGINWLHVGPVWLTIEARFDALFLDVPDRQFAYFPPQQIYVATLSVGVRRGADDAHAAGAAHSLDPPPLTGSPEVYAVGGGVDLAFGGHTDDFPAEVGGWLFARAGGRVARRVALLFDGEAFAYWTNACAGDECGPGLGYAALGAFSVQGFIGRWTLRAGAGPAWGGSMRGSSSFGVGGTVGVGVRTSRGWTFEAGVAPLWLPGAAHVGSAHVTLGLGYTWL